MTCFVSHTTVDCADAYAMAQWWQGVLNYAQDPDDPNEPGHDECLIVSPGGTHRLLFVEVPDSKQGKNRLHLDLRPEAATRDEELQRLLALGARELTDRREADGSGWVVLADPEGNEFCLLRSRQELEAGRRATSPAPHV